MRLWRGIWPFRGRVAPANAHSPGLSLFVGCVMRVTYPELRAPYMPGQMVFPSMTGRLNMIRKSTLVLIATGSLIAAAIAFSPGTHKPAAVKSAGTGYGYHYQTPTPRNLNRHVLDNCFSQPVECGLVVW
jgi:hypothetical protein